MALTVSADSGRFSNAAAVKLLLESPEGRRRGETWARWETAIDLCDVLFLVGYRFCGWNLEPGVMEKVSKQTSMAIAASQHNIVG